MTCRLAGTRQLALLPLADATATPPQVPLPSPAVVVAAFHGGLLVNGDKIVARFLGHRPVRSDPWLAIVDDAIRAGSTAWQVPPLVDSDFPAPDPAAAGAAATRPAVGAVLHHFVADAGRVR